ncbi:site-specific integrase [Hymenobacter siberiensis]|uniref:hypothetical protein n=1 Tax=Hymenobacter siberiensis TaxID=2848396 RepID=UPI001C1E3B8A|nr:hypothetical protein [Hymenobacter siberiensis]MBU6122614.1 hypothetical protein [Hymenobacter siberiensis]
MPAKKPESNVLKVANGATITPQLHHYLSKKDGGHHVLLRVTYAKQHSYLDSGIYAMPKDFDADTKTLKKPEQNLELRRLLREARVEVECFKPEELTPVRVKAAWERFKAGEQSHDWMDEVTTYMEEDSLRKLIAKREELEARLAEVNQHIKQLAEHTGTDVVKAEPSAQEVSEYEAAKKLFLTSLIGRKQRDRNAFDSFFTVLEECAKAKKFKLSLAVFDMQFYGAYAKYILDDRDNYNNTFGAHVKKLKAFLKYAESKKFKVNQDYKDREFKILEETKKVVYLDAEELDMLWNLKSIYPQNSNHIDLCVFQNLTGLRVGDCMQKHYVVTEKGEKFLSSTTQKTEGTYWIPLALDDRILEILEAHGNNMKIMSEAVYNRDIKGVLKKTYAHYGKEDTLIEYKRYKLKEGIDCESLKSDLITSHSARRGFISRNINSGHFNESDLLSMLGSKDYTQLKKYIKIESAALAAKAENSKRSVVVS